MRKKIFIKNIEQLIALVLCSSLNCFQMKILEHCEDYKMALFLCAKSIDNILLLFYKMLSSRRFKLQMLSDPLTSTHTVRTNLAVKSAAILNFCNRSYSLTNLTEIFHQPEHCVKFYHDWYKNTCFLCIRFVPKYYILSKNYVSVEKGNRE